MSKQLEFDFTAKAADTKPLLPAEIAPCPSWRRRHARSAAADIIRRPVHKWDWHRRDQRSVFVNQLISAGVRPSDAECEAKLFAIDLESQLRRLIINGILAQQHG